MRLYTSLFVFFILVLMNSYTVFARESVVLSGEEVVQFLSDRTMTVSEEEPDRDTGKQHSFKAFFSKLGGIRALGSDGEAFTLGWEIGENGALCVRNYARYRGELCGFVVIYKDVGFTVKKHKDTYSFYINDRGNTTAYTENGKVVFDPEWHHYMTFSDIQEGEKL